ncbi:MAG: hypothetical protein JWO30_2588 [Fibrobacteres bacterium]|nr:hypothetical protein [Fibrobacterota bacterium]
MFSQIAQVFSSQGVLLPGSERIPVYGKKGSEAPCDHKNDCSCFAAKFDQASAKLELSRQGMEKSAGKSAQKDSAGDPKKADGKPLDEDEQKQVRELEKRDREVKAHEAAHLAGAGGYAKGGAGYEYKAGPDGKQYAVGGHVDIDASPVKGNPRATLQKAATVQRAALAPSNPSGADRAVAAAAAQMAVQAQKEMAESPEGKDGGPESNAAGAGDPRRAYSRPAARPGTGFSAFA